MDVYAAAKAIPQLHSNPLHFWRYCIACMRASPDTDSLPTIQRVDIVPQYGARQVEKILAKYKEVDPLPEGPVMEHLIIIILPNGKILCLIGTRKGNPHLRP